MAATVAEQRTDEAGAPGDRLREPAGAGHARWVRACHWIVAASVLTLAFTGFVILMSHPRLYWGEVGNDLTPALLELPISRNYQHGGWANRASFFDGAGSPVSAIRTYDIFNENGWARSLHFLAAWFLVLTGAAYVFAGSVSGHLRRNIVPQGDDLAPRRLWQDAIDHLRPRPAAAGPPYGLLQKLSYFLVVLLGLPLMILTGASMSPAIAAALPFLPGLFGGSQSARTVHFLVFSTLVLFVVVHVLMVVLSGFRLQMRAMTIGGSR